VQANVSLIKSIPEEYLKQVEGAVMRSVQTGRDLGKLSKELQKKFGVSKRKAALISRDQNNKATSAFQRARQQELGITKAIWMHSHAGQEPRPSHVAMNGKEYDINKGMWDRDEQEWIFPGQLINCRCTSKSIIPGFS
jgi:SPP1 gp7 family putative phage head morphogenesis protein